MTLPPVEAVRNLAIIAHVDHGKTTLVDQLLYQSGMFRNEELRRLAGGRHDLILDSDDLERERGITIFSKNCAVRYATDDREYLLNIIDTPGHADFGGEVERVLAMADGALLLVDSAEGPMPQTRFVLEKALRHGLRPILFVNKIDRPDRRPDAVVEEVFDLLVDLDADDRTLDFPILYGSGREGWCAESADHRGTDLRPLLARVVAHVPSPHVRLDDPVQMLVTSIDHSEYVGRIAIGRLESGRLAAGQSVALVKGSGDVERRRILELHTFEGLGKRPAPEVSAGHICAISGLEGVDIGDTVAAVERPVGLASVPVDEPTLHMTFRINDGPFAGREGEYVTSRQLRERLWREVESDVALRVEEGESSEEFRVAGRGLMHLGILLENMRREGFELCAGKPTVVLREVEGKTCEPVERLVVECPAEVQSAVLRLVGERRGELVGMETRTASGGYLRMEFDIPARGLIGLRSRALTATRGEALLHHNFLRYQPAAGEIPKRKNGVMIAGVTGAVTAYSLDALYDRGAFFVRPGEAVYEGQVVGEHCKETDLVVNVTRNKKLTNVRAAGKDDQTSVKAARDLPLEEALEYIEEDELVEITPRAVRLRKRILSEAARRRASRRGR